MPRLLLTALIAAIVVALMAMALRSLGRTAEVVRERTAARLGPHPLGETPMQRLSFVLLCALILYAAIWGAA